MKTGKILQVLFALTVGFSLLSGCYRVPEEGEYSVIPATNNPGVVGNRGSQSILPSTGF